MMLRSLLVVSSLLLTLPAQRGEAAKKPIPTKPAASTEAFDSAGADLRTVEGKVVKLTPEQIANAGVRRGASSYCQFHVHTRPAKVMPGQAATVIVTVVLKGQAVLLSPVPLEVTSGGQQGLLTLGGVAFQPAGLGRLAKAYLGRPVYDNYAIFELPVTVSSEAVVGQKLNLGIEMKFDLFDGNSAQSIGTFRDRAVGTVEVGQSLDPAVRGGYTPPVSVEPTADWGADTDGEQGRTSESPAAALGGASSAVLVEVPEPAVSSSAPQPMATPEVGEEEGSFLILILGGGALLAAVLLLLLKRK